MELISPLFVNVIAVLAIVAGLAFGAWLIIGLYWMHSREAEKKLPELTAPADLREIATGPPPALTIFYVLTLLSLVGYVLYIWLGGRAYARKFVL